MPEKLEKELTSKAKKKFGSSQGERAKAYIFGTMRKTGWRPSREEKK
jgi:hypothetical protein